MVTVGWLVLLQHLISCGSNQSPDSREFILNLGQPYQLTANQRDSLTQQQNPHLRRAIAIKSAADESNIKDINFLLEQVAVQGPPESGFSAILQKKLTDNLIKARELRTALSNNGNAGSAALQTSLDKLISSGKNEDGSALTGIYQDAQTFYNEYNQHIHQGTIPISLSHNKITVAKVLLLTILNLRNPDQTKEMIDAVDLIYPELFPAAIPTELYEGFGLTDAGTRKVYFPNAGYIFGGNFVGEENKGVDCSAYVSRATSSSIRMSTAYMKVAWLVTRGREDEVNQRLLREFEAIGLDTTISEFAAVTVNSVADLNPGDLVVWRSSAGGHVTMHTGLTEDNRFIGIEATRSDQKNREGIMYIRHRLFPPNKKTFVLRRRT